MKKIIISKIPTIGSVRNVNTGLNKSDGFSDRALNKVQCNETFDNKTTYVRKKEYNVALQLTLFPPYVDCGYVV